MRKNLTRTAVVATAIVATTTVTAGVASWSASGAATGSSGGRSVAKQPLTVSVTAPSGLYPTQLNAGQLTVTVDNDNPYNVTLTDADVTAVSCATTPAATPIPLDDFSFADAVVSTAVAVRDTVSSGAAVEGADAVATIAISEVKDLPEGCDAKDISFAVSVTGQQSTR